MKLYYVYTQKVCAQLMLKGYKLISIEPSKKHEGFNIFGFEDTERLRNEIEKIKTANG